MLYVWVTYLNKQINKNKKNIIQSWYFKTFFRTVSKCKSYISYTALAFLIFLRSDFELYPFRKVVSIHPDKVIISSNIKKHQGEHTSTLPLKSWHLKTIPPDKNAAYSPGGECWLRPNQ